MRITTSSPGAATPPMPSQLRGYNIGYREAGYMGADCIESRVH
tara:strand:+ start:446 stop:574 length:129 start_codon:yes stop_codon:yes gene_type:complete